MSTVRMHVKVNDYADVEIDLHDLDTDDLITELFARANRGSEAATVALHKLEQLREEPTDGPTAEEAWLALRSRDTPQSRDTIERFVCAAAGRICP